MPLERKANITRSPTTRSRVSNGRRLFAEGDGRSPWARRFRDLVEMHADDLGGAARLSQAQLSLIRRAAAMEVELEKVESHLANGNETDLDVYSRASGHLRRVLESLGIRRTAKAIANPLADHFSRPPIREAAL